MTDRYPKTVWLPFAAIGLVVFILAGCRPWQHQPSPQGSLIIRIDQYYSALQAKAYTRSILFHAHQHNYKKPETSSLASKLTLEMASYDIQSMQVDDLDARVVMHITLSGHDNQFDIVVLDHWQFIGDNWFVVEAVQAPMDEAIKTLDQDVWQGGINW